MALLRFNNTFIIQRSFAFAMERFLFHADFAEVIFSPEILHWFIFRKNPLRSSRNLRATNKSQFLSHADFADFAEVIFLQRFVTGSYSSKRLCILRVICVRHKEGCPQPSVAVK